VSAWGADGSEPSTGGPPGHGAWINPEQSGHLGGGQQAVIKNEIASAWTGTGESLSSGYGLPCCLTER
jgi:hypothetical protein